MTTFQAWIPPAGEVVDPPVHPETVVDVILDDGDRREGWLAGSQNWSSFGDGPGIVAYAVVNEYKPAPGPRERYLCIHHNGNEVMLDRDLDNIADLGWKVGENAFLMREVLEGREVVAWAAVKGAMVTPCNCESSAETVAKLIGGTVVRLTGVMPNE